MENVCNYNLLTHYESGSFNINYQFVYSFITLF